MTRTISVCVLGMLLFSGCSKSVLEVELEVKGGSVSDVYVIAGADKIYWPLVADGDTHRVASTTSLPAELTVLYTFQKENRVSRGPDIRQKSRVAILVEPAAPPDRSVTYRVTPSRP